MAYLESLFTPGMSWDKQKQGEIHIDHIIPFASFDLEDREQLLAVCHYTNLQPMWAEDNIAKSDKMPEEWAAYVAKYGLPSDKIR